MENRKIVVASYFLASFILWFLTRHALYFLHQTFYEVRKLPGVLVAREALPLLVGVITFVVLVKNAKANIFFDEVVSELKKVTWPSRPDVIRSTTVVLVCIVIASGFIAAVDLFWGKLVGFLLSL